jgi:hypothetical protein
MNRAQPRQEPQSSFLVKGVIAWPPKVGPAWVFVTVRDNGIYHDVKCWEDGPIQEFRQLREGMPVKIAGFLGKSKMKDMFNAAGRPIYETTLIARRVAIETQDQARVQARIQRAQDSMMAIRSGLLAAQHPPAVQHPAAQPEAPGDDLPF